MISEEKFDAMTAEQKFSIVSQPIDLPFLSLAERQRQADDGHSPRLPYVEPAHSTKDELEFIAGMQTDKNGTLANKLHGYLAGCEKRVRWGRIDKNAAIAAAHARLAEIAEPVAA